MKTICFILILGHCFFSFAASSEDAKLNELLEHVGVTDFLSAVKKIKTYKSIEQIEELDYQLKAYYPNIELWKKFDEVQYEKGLRAKLKQGFSAEEIIQLKNVFKKPFLAKVIKAMVVKRDFFELYQNMLNSKFVLPELVKSRFMLMKNLYLLNGMEIQNEKIKDFLLSYSETDIEYLTLIQKISRKRVITSPKLLKKRIENSQDFLIKYMARDLNSFRHYEFREYLRVMKGETAQRFLQFFTNYHALYLLKFFDSYKIPKDLLKS